MKKKYTVIIPGNECSFFLSKILLPYTNIWGKGRGKKKKLLQWRLAECIARV